MIEGFTKLLGNANKISISGFAIKYMDLKYHLPIAHTLVPFSDQACTLSFDLVAA